MAETCLNLDAGTEMRSANKHLQTALKDWGSLNHGFDHLSILIICLFPPNFKLFSVVHYQSGVDISQMPAVNPCVAFDVSIQHRHRQGPMACYACRKKVLRSAYRSIALETGPGPAYSMPPPGCERWQAVTPVG